MGNLTFSLIQTNLHWEEPGSNLRMLEQKINSIHEPTQVVVLPEMFSTGFSMVPQKWAEKMDGSSINWMKKIATSKKVILTGSLIIEEEGRYYNRMVWMLPNGDLGYYDKRHRFAFASEDEHYTAGNKRTIAQVNGWKINLQVCYDLRFPVWARQTPKTDGVTSSPAPEYDVLLYVANWPERRTHAWKTLLMARAIENQCYVVGVNRTGYDGNDIYHSGASSVVDPLGDVLYQKENEEDIHTISLDKDFLDETRTKFPFWKDADAFTRS